MNISIIENQDYTLEVNTLKNRIYFKVRGTLKSENVPYFAAHWKKAVEKVEPNFTVLVDCRIMQIQEKKMEKIHEEVQKYLIENKLLQIAQVVAMNDIADLQFNHIVERSEVPIKKFKSIEVAEIYLNEITEKRKLSLNNTNN